MAIKMVIDGIVMEVPPGEIGTVLRQIRELNGTPAQRAPTQQKQHPPAQSVLIPAADWPMPQPTARADSAPQPQEVLIPHTPADHELAVKFLDLIQSQHGHGGATAGQLAHVMGIKSPKGVGNKAKMVNNVIEAYGFKLNDVYRNPRDSTGTRHWLAGPKLKAALDTIRKGGAGA